MMVSIVLRIFYLNFYFFSNYFYLSTDDDDDEIPPSQISSVYSHKRLKREEEEAAAGAAMSTSTNGMSKDTAWTPLSKTYFYSDGESKDKMVLLILLPSGVNECFTYKLEKEGEVVEFSIRWPDPFYKPDELYIPIAEDFLQEDNKGTVRNHFYKLAAMKKETMHMCNKMEGYMWSKCRINLPKSAYGDPSALCLLGKDGSLILELDMFVRQKGNVSVKTGAGLLRS